MLPRLTIPRKVKIALAILLVLAIAGAIAFLVMFPWALTNEAEPGVEGPAIPVISMATTGKAGLDAYARTCSYCHDQGIGPNLREKELEPEGITYLVRSGFGPMPPFRASEISDADLKALADIIAHKQLPALPK